MYKEAASNFLYSGFKYIYHLFFPFLYFTLSNNQIHLFQGFLCFQQKVQKWFPVGNKKTFINCFMISKMAPSSTLSLLFGVYFFFQVRHSSELTEVAKADSSLIKASQFAQKVQSTWNPCLSDVAASQMSFAPSDFPYFKTSIIWTMPLFVWTSQPQNCFSDICPMFPWY